MAKKLESTLLNMVFSLVFISMGMSAALAVVYLKTRGPIEEAAKQKEINAIKEVMPAFDNAPAASRIHREGLVIYPLSHQDKQVGYAVKSFTDKGFAGHIEIMAGFLPDGSIYNVAVLQQKETPGLGTKMSEPRFSGQFLGKNPETFILKLKKDGGQVDAITAATISSRAYCDALQRAYETLRIVSYSISNKR